MRHALIPSLSLALLLGLAACGSDVADVSNPPSDTVEDSAPVDSSDPGQDSADPADPAEPTEPAPTPDPQPEPVNPDEPVVTPEDPGSADVAFDIDSTEGELQPISPFIYGTNDRGKVLPDYMAFGRFGGNRLSAYNWENNASNAGSDYNHQNDAHLGGGDTPGGAVSRRIDDARAVGAASLITVPMLDYLAADKNGGGDVRNSANYLQTRFVKNSSRKPGEFSTQPDLNDGVVYQDEFVSWVESAYPDQTIFYSMDNEPALWDHTHARIHPNPVGFQELVDRTTEYATMVKDVAGDDAKTFAGVFFGWAGMTNLRGAPDANGRDFIDFLLTEMKAEEEAQGRRIMDVLDFHWYPEARGGGQRIINIGGGADSTAPEVVKARLQAPRSLWDPTFKEDSWIAQNLGEPIAILPRMQDKIDRLYPGTKMAITEYFYGGGEHISGGIAQADVLGVYGREGLYAANLWHLTKTDARYVYGAFQMYRNFDGQGTNFGDLSVPADTTDVAGTSVYASVDSENPDQVIVVAINKTAQPQTAGIRVTHRGELNRAEVYQMTDGNPNPVRADDIQSVGVNAFAYTMPAYSVSTLVLTQ